MVDQSADIRMKRPARPGSFIRGEVIEGMGISVSEVANALGVAEIEFCALIDGRAPISPEVADRIEDTFGISKRTLMRMQESYELSVKEKDA